MHPAKSVIFFTTASGAGYGLLIWLALLGPFGVLPQGIVFTVLSFGLGVGLVVAGLLSSTFHLGHPERAWRAISQWRSSWLSREGLLALITFLPALIWGVAVLSTGFSGALASATGLLTAVLAIATVYSTGMIYASLRTIPAWHNDFTRFGYPLFSLMTGAALTVLLVATFRPGATGSLVEFAIVLFVAGGLLKFFYWRWLDDSKPVSTAETATGLGSFGKVRLLEKPHTGTNYLMREMGFQIARKHADKLRNISLVTGFVLPALLLLLAVIVPSLLIVLALLAVLSAGIGIALERWLFFAEAKHAVMLYYGETAV